MAEDAAVESSHTHREVAEAFGGDAERYDRARPSYPDALIQRIVERSPGTEVLDVGTGTGIVARQLRDAGCTVAGVEVDERMADVARRSGFAVDVSTFEDWEPAGRAFDAVVVGQAWHWIDPARGVARAAQALRPGGLFVPFWNAVNPPREIAEAFAAVYDRVAPDLPFSIWSQDLVAMYETGCDKAGADLQEAGGFDAPEQWRFDWTQTYTRDEWLDVVPTWGGHSMIPAPVLSELLAGIGAVIDEAGGTLTMPYRAVAVAAHRH